MPGFGVFAIGVHSFFGVNDPDLGGLIDADTGILGVFPE
jgi:hypothetical protein